MSHITFTPPPGHDALPDFENGWRRPDGAAEPFLSYVAEDYAVNWSDALEELHEESSRSHFIDILTRRTMLAQLGTLPADATIADLGCSTGYLLEDLREAHGAATLLGVDLVGAGLRKAHANVPEARLIQADLCELPLADASVDGIVSANVLEHVPDDAAALAEVRRILRAGACAVLVVPAGPGIYDYYDRFLGHERRYARGELARKAEHAGLEVLDDFYLASLIYPAFWLVKQRNRRLHDHLQGAALEARVASDIESTQDSRVGRLVCDLERRLSERRVRLPFGIRSLVVARRPRADG